MIKDKAKYYSGRNTIWGLAAGFIREILLPLFFFSRTVNAFLFYLCPALVLPQSLNMNVTPFLPEGVWQYHMIDPPCAT